MDMGWNRAEGSSTKMKTKLTIGYYGQVERTRRVVGER